MSAENGESIRPCTHFPVYKNRTGVSAVVTRQFRSACVKKMQCKGTMHTKHCATSLCSHTGCVELVGLKAGVAAQPGDCQDDTQLEFTIDSNDPILERKLNFLRSAPDVWHPGGPFFPFTPGGCTPDQAENGTCPKLPPQVLPQACFCLDP